jgi:ribonuclease BN (tRNA processing enzyme)
MPTDPGTTAVEALLPGFSPPSFPVPVTDICAAWEFAPASAEMTLGAWDVRTSAVHHKGGPTIGIRVERSGRALVYIPDHDLGQHDPLALALARKADVLLHDGQYLAQELDRYRGYGHSTVEAAIEFARRAEVKHLVLTHHAPFRTDRALDDIAAEFEGDRHGLLVTVGAQGGLMAV